MNILNTILLTTYKSGGEAILVGLLQGLIIWGGITIYRSIKKTAQGKKFDEVKEEEKNKHQNL